MRCIADIWLVLVACGGCTASDDIHAPTIANVSPSHAPTGAAIAVTGSSFCQQPASGSDGDPLACENVGMVLFGSSAVTSSLYTDELIMVDVPTASQGIVDVRVSVAGRTSNSVELAVE